MPVRTVPNTDPPLQYYLIAFDENGRERREPDGSMLSDKVLQTMAAGPVTDVFVMSHGWLGDVPGAVSQYDAWTTNLMKAVSDIQAMNQRRPGFRPMLVGMHWPSQPWGDESISGSFAIGDSAGPLDDTIEKAAADQAARLAAGPEAEAELRAIYRAYATVDNPDTLPPDLEQSYQRLYAMLRPGVGGSTGSAPGDDLPPFDPQSVFRAAKRDQEMDLAIGASFGALSWDTVLMPLRILSFWRMKDRARSLGEGGGHGLLLAMQNATAAKDVRIHLMGHSFGCIVMTATAAGPAGDSAPRKPVQSIVLAQGALSLWAYCDSVPGSAAPGYFNRLIKLQRCDGPIATTQSQYDKSVGKAYPIAAGLAQQDSFAVPSQLPTYGGIGTWGIQGLDAITNSTKLANVTADYAFERGRIYNLNSDDFISGNHGQNDAHCDIVHLEVAHLIWQAALPR